MPSKDSEQPVFAQSDLLGHIFVLAKDAKFLHADNEGSDQTAWMFVCLFVLRFYGPVNPMGSCRVQSVYLTTRLLGRLSPPSG